MPIAEESRSDTPRRRDWRVSALLLVIWVVALAAITWRGTEIPLSMLIIGTVFFVVLGCFLDGISVVVLTTSVVLPMVQAAGIDLIWFGIFIVIVVEMSQITPPVGFNLFVLQALTGHDILRIARASLPFFFLLLLAAALITAFPGLATYLPDQMGR